MAPFHIWLPYVHTEAPTSGSVLLAALLLKLGTYGILRFCIPLFPIATLYYSPLIWVLSIISILYSCIVALSLIDLKQIIAYSSIAHMNLCLIGLFSNDLYGLQGAYFASISHGFISSALFFIVGFLYDRFHTRILKYFRGLVLFLPLIITFLFIFILSNSGFPGSAGFIGELFIYLSTLNLNPLLSLLVTLLAILLPIYTIWTFNKISFGRISNYFPYLSQDLTFKEFHILLPLLIASIYFGLQPNLILDTLLLPLTALLIG